MSFINYIPEVQRHSFLFSNGKFSLSKFIELDKKYFPLPWSQEDWIGLEGKDYRLFHIMLRKKMVGFSLFRIDSYNYLSHLCKIIINPSNRGRGFGKFLLEESLNMLKSEGIHKVYLEVSVENIWALNMYHDCGLEIQHKKDNYFENGAYIVSNYHFGV